MKLSCRRVEDNGASIAPGHEEEDWAGDMPTPTFKLKKKRGEWWREGKKRGHAWTNHLLQSELALSLLLALIQVRLAPLADKQTLLKT